MIANRIFKTYVFFVFYIAMIKSVVPLSFLNFADDIVFSFMVAYCIANTKKFILYPFKLLLLLSVMFIISMIYSFNNGNDISAILLYFRHYKNFYLIFFLSFLHPSVVHWLLNYVKVALYISIPVSIYQFNTADYSNTAWWDEVGGVFGREGHSGTLSLLILTYVSCEYFRRLRDGKKLFDWYLIITIPMFINETKLVLFLFPVIFFIASCTMGSMYRKKVVLITPILFLGAVVLNYMYIAFFGSSPINAISLDFIEGYFFIDEDYSAQQIDIGRFTRINYAIDYLKQQGDLFFLFGEGFGSTFYGNNSGVEGKVVSAFYDLRLHTGSRNQLYQMLLDFGLIGTMFMYATILYYWFRVFLIKRRTDEVVLALIVIPVFIVSTVYQAVIESKVIFFLLIVSIFFSLRKVNNN